MSEEKKTAWQCECGERDRQLACGACLRCLWCCSCDDDADFDDDELGVDTEEDYE